MNKGLSPLEQLKIYINEKKLTEPLSKRLLEEKNEIFFQREAAVMFESKARTSPIEKLFEDYKKEKLKINSKNAKIFQLWLDWICNFSDEEAKEIPDIDKEARGFYLGQDESKSKSNVSIPADLFYHFFIKRELRVSDNLNFAESYCQGLGDVFDNLTRRGESNGDGSFFRHYLVGKSHYANSSARQIELVDTSSGETIYKGKSYATSLIRMEAENPHFLALGGSAPLVEYGLKRKSGEAGLPMAELAEAVQAEKKQLERRFKQLQARLEYELLSTSLKHPLVKKINQVFKLSNVIKTLPDVILPEYIEDLVSILRFLQGSGKDEHDIAKISEKIDLYYTLAILNYQDKLYAIIADLATKFKNASKKNIVKKLQDIIFVYFDSINKNLDVNSPILETIERLYNEFQDPAIVNSEKFEIYLDLQIENLANIKSGYLVQKESASRHFVRNRMHHYIAERRELKRNAKLDQTKFGKDGQDLFDEENVCAIALMDEDYYGHIIKLLGGNSGNGELKYAESKDEKRDLSELGTTPEAIIAFFGRFKRWIKDNVFGIGSLDIFALENPSILSHLWKFSVDIAVSGLKDASKQEDLRELLKNIDFNQLILTRQDIDVAMKKYHEGSAYMEKFFNKLINLPVEEIYHHYANLNECQKEKLKNEFLSKFTILLEVNKDLISVIRCLVVINKNDQVFCLEIFKKFFELKKLEDITKSIIFLIEREFSADKESILGIIKDFYNNFSKDSFFKSCTSSITPLVNALRLAEIAILGEDNPSQLYTIEKFSCENFVKLNQDSKITQEENNFNTVAKKFINKLVDSRREQIKDELQDNRKEDPEVKRIASFISLNKDIFNEDINLSVKDDDEEYEPKHLIEEKIDISNLGVNSEEVVRFFNQFRLWVKSNIFKDMALDICAEKKHSILANLWKFFIKVGIKNVRNPHRKKYLQKILKHINCTQLTLNKKDVEDAVKNYRMEIWVDKLMALSAEEIPEYYKKLDQTDQKKLNDEFLRRIPSDYEPDSAATVGKELVNIMRCVVAINDVSLSSAICRKLASYNYFEYMTKELIFLLRAKIVIDKEAMEGFDTLKSFYQFFENDLFDSSYNSLRQYIHLINSAKQSIARETDASKLQSIGERAIGACHKWPGIATIATKFINSLIKDKCEQIKSKNVILPISLRDLLSIEDTLSADQIAEGISNYYTKNNFCIIKSGASADFLQNFVQNLLEKELALESLDDIDFKKLVEIHEKFSLSSANSANSFIAGFDFLKAAIIRTYVDYIQKEIDRRSKILYTAHLQIENTAQRDYDTADDGFGGVSQNVLDAKASGQVQRYAGCPSLKGFFDHLDEARDANRISNIEYVELAIKFLHKMPGPFPYAYLRNRLNTAYCNSECSIDQYYELLGRLVKLQGNLEKRMQLKPSIYQQPISSNYVYEWIELVITKNNLKWINASHSTTKLIANFSSVFSNVDSLESRPRGIKEISTVLKLQDKDPKEKLVLIEKIADKHLQDGARFRADITRDFYQLILILLEHPEMPAQIFLELTEGFKQKYSLQEKENSYHNSGQREAKGEAPARNRLSASY